MQDFKGANYWSVATFLWLRLLPYCWNERATRDAAEFFWKWFRPLPGGEALDLIEKVWSLLEKTVEPIERGQTYFEGTNNDAKEMTAKHGDTASGSAAPPDFSNGPVASGPHHSNRYDMVPVWDGEDVWDRWPRVRRAIRLWEHDTDIAAEKEGRAYSGR